MTIRIFTTAFAVLLLAGTAHASKDEAKCLAGRANAKSRYEGCVNKALGKLYSQKEADGAFDKFDEATQKCRASYGAAWTKLQALTGSPTCGGKPRFVDNGDGTILDNLSGLIWEKKSDNGDIHDQDRGWSWMAADAPPYYGNGTAFTQFLGVAATSLNETGFAGANDWRLPTVAELNAIMLPWSAILNDDGIAVAPATDPIFNTGCTPGCSVLTCSCANLDASYFTATTVAYETSFAWVVDARVGYVDFVTKDTFVDNYAYSARAVRGGL